MGDTIKARKGIKASIDPLLLGEFGFTTDEERVYIGGNNGNIPLPNAADLSEKANNTDVTNIVNLNKKFNEALISANQSIPNATNTIVSLGSIGGAGNATIEGGSVKINEKGLYIINVMAWYTANSTGVRHFKLKNKATNYQYIIETKSAQPYFENTINAMTIANLVQGSILDLVTYQDSGVALDLTQVRVQMKRVN